MLERYTYPITTLGKNFPVLDQFNAHPLFNESWGRLGNLVGSTSQEGHYDISEAIRSMRNFQHTVFYKFTPGTDNVFKATYNIVRYESYLTLSRTMGVTSVADSIRSFVILVMNNLCHGHTLPGMTIGQSQVVYGFIFGSDTVAGGTVSGHPFIQELLNTFGSRAPSPRDLDFMRVLAEDFSLGDKKARLLLAVLRRSGLDP